MGTKKELAKQIASTSQTMASGPFLDLFSGISAAGANIGTTRQVWCNDVQVFSRTLTEAIYLSKSDDVRTDDIAARILAYGNKNLQLLMTAYNALVEKETTVIFGGDTDAQVALQSEVSESVSATEEALRASGAACVLSTRYAGTYLGITQCVQLDSIRYGCDQALALGDIDFEQHRWCVLAICRALAALSNSTGHFAQYLTARPDNIARIISKRRRCAWDYWVQALRDMRPRGTSSWRNRNKVFHGDANLVLDQIHLQGGRPAIVYADPPYTSDQYSRYYHLLDTAVLYDYPASSGKGQYRGDRFTSKFSLKTKVRKEFEELIEKAAKIRSSLIVSYPSNGLLENSLDEIPRMMRQSYRYVRKPLIIPHHHSTMGGSKGPHRALVDECIFVARP